MGFTPRVGSIPTSGTNSFGSLRGSPSAVESFDAPIPARTEYVSRDDAAPSARVRRTEQAGRSVPWDRRPRRSLAPTTIGFALGVGRSERLGDTPYVFTGAADERPAVVPAQEMRSRDLFRLASWAQHSGFSSHRRHRRVRGMYWQASGARRSKLHTAREPMTERRSR